MTRSRRFSPPQSSSCIDNHPRSAWLVAVRALKIPENGPKRKLLEAAELLVAENGFETVSVRNISAAAKANIAAVNYHFGSRETLMDLLMHRLLKPLCEERLRALERAEHQKNTKASPGATVLELVTAFTSALPTTADQLKMQPLFFLKLMGRILVMPPEKLDPAIAGQRNQVTERFLAAFARSLPDFPEVELKASWRFFDSGLSQSLLTLNPADDISALFSTWIAFGAKALGETKPIEKETKKADSQELLFDF